LSSCSVKVCPHFDDERQR